MAASAACAAKSACASSVLIFVGCCTVRPCASANSLTGGTCKCLPRPAGLSGCVHTATTSCPSSRQRLSVGTAESGVPMKTKRIKLSRQFQSIHRARLLKHRNHEITLNNRKQKTRNFVLHYSCCFV